MQSQEKKVGDRQSVPNIDDTINVQLDDDVNPGNRREGPQEDDLDDSPKSVDRGKLPTLSD